MDMGMSRRKRLGIKMNPKAKRREAWKRHILHVMRNGEIQVIKVELGARTDKNPRMLLLHCLLECLGKT